MAAEVLLSRLSNGAGTDTPVLSQDAGHQYIAFWTGFASGTSVDVSVRLNAAWQTERMSPQAPRYRGYRFPGSLRKKRSAVRRSAARRNVLPSVVHRTDQPANNRAAVSHQPARQRKRQIRPCKSAAHAQRFLSVHGPVQNLCRVDRHLLTAAYHCLLMARSFRVWDEMTCAH